MNHSPNVALAIAAFVIGAVVLTLTPSRKAPQLQVDELEAPVPLQEWHTADAGAIGLRLVLAGLKTHPGQKLEDCDPDLGEQLRNGACWMETKVPPPCPKGKLQEDEGRCWRPVPKTARVPTSVPTNAERRSAGVADP